MNRVVLVLLICTLAVPTSAAETTRSRLIGSEVQATFVTFSGCEDASVGVTVLNNTLTHQPGDRGEIFEVSVFGNFENICDGGGGSTSFFGTAPLAPHEFTQHGLHDATLKKTFTVNGFDVALDLTWDGMGEALKYRSSLNHDGPPKVRGRENVFVRNADVTGSFFVDELNRIEGGTVRNGHLVTIRTTRISQE